MGLPEKGRAQPIPPQRVINRHFPALTRRCGYRRSHGETW